MSSHRNKAVMKPTRKPVSVKGTGTRRDRTSNKENALGAPLRSVKSTRTTSVSAIAPKKSFRVTSALTQFDVSLTLTEVDIIRRHCRCAHPFPPAPTLYANEQVSALHHWAAACAWAVTPSGVDRVSVGNLTSAMANGVALACIIAYYTPTALPTETIDWPTKRGAPVDDADAGTADDSSRNWVGAFSFAEIARTTESDESRIARTNFQRIRLALNALAIADINVSSTQCSEQSVIAALTLFAGRFIPESARIHAAKCIQRAYRRYRQRRTLRRQTAPTTVVAAAISAPLYAARLEGVRQRMAQRQRTHSQYQLATERLVGAVYALSLRRYLEQFKAAAAVARAERVFHATRLQSIFRGNVARRRYHNDVYLKLLNARQGEWQRTCDAAATRIQSVWRGYRMRRIVFTLMQMKADAETDVLIRKQTLTAASSALRIQRWWRHRRTVATYGLALLHWYRYKAAVGNIQRCVRGFISRRAIDFNRSRNAALRIQSVWRAHVVRRCLHRDHRLTRIRHELRRPHHRTDSIGVRADSAVNALMTAQTMVEVTTACATLELATRLVRATIQAAIDAGAVPALFAIIRSANRSRAHVQLVTVCFRLLLNMTATFNGYNAVFRYDGAADALTEQMHVYRDKFDAFVAAAALMERYKWSAAEAVSGKRVQSLRALLCQQLALEHKYARRFHSLQENVARSKLPPAHAHTIRDSKRIVQLQTALRHCERILEHMAVSR